MRARPIREYPSYAEVTAALAALDNQFLAKLFTGMREVDPHHFYIGLITADDSEGGSID